MSRKKNKKGEKNEENEESSEKKSLSGTTVAACVLVFLLCFTNLTYYMSNNGYVWNITKIGTVVKDGAGKGVKMPTITLNKTFQ